MKAVGQKLYEQLVSWFTNAAPGESITYKDVALKFGISERYAKNALCVLQSEGLIRHETVWRLADDMAHLKEPKHG